MCYRIFVTSPGLATEARTLLEDEGCHLQVGELTRAPEDIARAHAGGSPAGRPHRQIREDQ